MTTPTTEAPTTPTPSTPPTAPAITPARVLRSVPGAIGAFVGGVLIAPEILGTLPYEAVDTAVRYFPTQAAGALGSSTPIPGAASPGAALPALLLWASAALAVPALLLKRRDV